MIELAIRQYMLCLLPNRIVVLLRPALLQTDNVGSGVRSGDLVCDFREALVAECCYVFEAPAVE